MDRTIKNLGELELNITGYENAHTSNVYVYPSNFGKYNVRLDCFPLSCRKEYVGYITVTQPSLCGLSDEERDKLYEKINDEIIAWLINKGYAWDVEEEYYRQMRAQEEEDELILFHGFDPFLDEEAEAAAEAEEKELIAKYGVVASEKLWRATYDEFEPGQREYHSRLQKRVIDRVRVELEQGHNCM